MRVFHSSSPNQRSSAAEIRERLRDCLGPADARRAPASAGDIRRSSDSRLVPFGSRRGHHRSRGSRARSVARSRSTFTAWLSYIRRCDDPLPVCALAVNRLRLGFRFRRFWSGAPRSGGGSSQAINLPCRSQRVITRKRFRVAKQALSSGSARFCSTAELGG